LIRPALPFASIPQLAAVAAAEEEADVGTAGPGPGAVVEQAETTMAAPARVSARGTTSSRKQLSKGNKGRTGL
jgi:hypothetical protein